jgi:hypothetical protein
VETQKRALQHLSNIFPSDEHTNREVWREYIPHVARMRDVGFGITFGREQERVNIVPAVHPASVNFKRDLVTPVHRRAAATVGFEEPISLQPQ